MSPVTFLSHRSTKERLTCDYDFQQNLAPTEKKTLTPKVSSPINKFLAIFASLAFVIDSTNLQKSFHPSGI